MRTFLLATILALAAPAAFVAEPQNEPVGRLCKGNPGVVGPCFKVHGRIRFKNGTPDMVIWRIGTDRILGVIPAENEILPNNLKKALADAGEWPEAYGDFEVCPFTKEKPEEMQLVCVESASHVAIKKNAY